MDPDDRKFIKARPLAGKLGLCPRTIFRWADAGHIHRFKINERVVHFDENEVMAFVQASRVG
jgi:predicted DNA-binding transcriptional regulator AlpA